MEELKILFLVVAVIYSFLRILSGDVLLPLVLLVLSGYLLYSENKREHWEMFKEFVRDFRRDEVLQEEVLEGYDSTVDDVIEDEELLHKLGEEMKRKRDEFEEVRE